MSANSGMIFRLKDGRHVITNKELIKKFDGKVPTGKTVFYLYDENLEPIHSASNPIHQAITFKSQIDLQFVGFVD